MYDHSQRQSGGYDDQEEKFQSGVSAGSSPASGERHDRDINAAKNILAVGQGRLAEGIPVLSA